MMLNRKYTKGDWTYEYSPYHSDTIGEIGAYEVVAGDMKICDTNENAAVDEQEANARLIAAAPRLVEALDDQTKAAQRVVDCWCEGDLAGAVRSLDCCLDGSRRILEEATGS